MWLATWHTEWVTSPKNRDRHADDRAGIAVRAPIAIRDEAKALLVERGWTLNDFLVASLALLPKNPDPYLARLAQFRPARRAGRPPAKRTKKAARPQAS
jgi:hypothetical protein